MGNNSRYEGLGLQIDYNDALIKDNSVFGREWLDNNQEADGKIFREAASGLHLCW